MCAVPVGVRGHTNNLKRVKACAAPPPPRSPVHGGPLHPAVQPSIHVQRDEKHRKHPGGRLFDFVTTKIWAVAFHGVLGRLFIRPDP